MNAAEEIVHTLTTFPLARSVDAVDMEDLLVVTLFASRRLDSENSHIPRMLGQTFNHSGEMLHTLASLFKKKQDDFDVKDSAKHLSAAIDFTSSLSSETCFGQLDESQLTVLRW